MRYGDDRRRYPLFNFLIKVFLINYSQFSLTILPIVVTKVAETDHIHQDHQGTAEEETEVGEGIGLTDLDLRTALGAEDIEEGLTVLESQTTLQLEGQRTEGLPDLIDLRPADTLKTIAGILDLREMTLLGLEIERETRVLQDQVGTNTLTEVARIQDHLARMVKSKIRRSNLPRTKPQFQ